MTESPSKIGWFLTVFVVGVLVGACLVGPHILPRYKVYTHSIIIMKLDTWTGRTWIMRKGEWEERTNKE